MSDFTQLSVYLSDITTQKVRERIVTTCMNMADAGCHQLQPDVDRLLMMSNVGEADAVLDDLYHLIFEHLQRITQDVGFVWVDDIDFREDFSLVAETFNTLLKVTDIEDYGTLMPILDGDETTEEKVVAILTDVACRDMSELLNRVTMITEGVLAIIRYAISEPYQNAGDEELTQDYLFVRDRLVKHYGRVKGTIAEQHIAACGVLAADYDSLIALYNAHLVGNPDANPSPEFLVKELIALGLLSNTSDASLLDEITKRINQWVTDPMAQTMVGRELMEFFNECS